MEKCGKDLRTVLKKEALDIDSLIEREDAKRLFPEAEYVDGRMKAKYGDCFIRGNNVLCISSA